jgi:hypothetical protein
MSNESFITEVNEELRSDRARKLWRTYGPWVIGACVAIVLAVAGNEGWSWWQSSNSSRSAQQFYDAQALVEGGDVAGAQLALGKLESDGSSGYPLLARFREAGLLVRDGKVAEAVAAYDALATGQEDRNLRELALVLAGYALVDGGDVAAVEQRLGSIAATPDSPLRNAAREALGLVKYQAGDLAAAVVEFDAAINDPSTSQELRTRVEIYRNQLVAQGAPEPVADTATVEPEPTASETAMDAASEAPAAGN